MTRQPWKKPAACKQPALHSRPFKQEQMPAGSIRGRRSGDATRAPPVGGALEVWCGRLSRSLRRHYGVTASSAVPPLVDWTSTLLTCAVGPGFCLSDQLPSVSTWALPSFVAARPGVMSYTTTEVAGVNTPVAPGKVDVPSIRSSVPRRCLAVVIATLSFVMPRSNVVELVAGWPSAPTPVTVSLMTAGPTALVVIGFVSVVLAKNGTFTVGLATVGFTMVTAGPLTWLQA